MVFGHFDQHKSNQVASPKDEKSTYDFPVNSFQFSENLLMSQQRTNNLEQNDCDEIEMTYADDQE